jgi:hypothetical protein
MYKYTTSNFHFSCFGGFEVRKSPLTRLLRSMYDSGRKNVSTTAGRPMG